MCQNHVFLIAKSVYSHTLIAKGLRDLQRSLQIDLESLLTTITEASNKNEKNKNIDSIFMLMVPLYFLASLKLNDSQSVATVRSNS
jgi:hypothetical protein